MQAREARVGREAQGGAELCRACLRARPAREAVSLWTRWKPPWGEAQGAVCVARELAAVAGTTIEPGDDFPSHICLACFESFTEMYSFLYNVRQSDHIMRINKHIFLSKEEPEAVFSRTVGVRKSKSTSVDGSVDEVFLDEEIKEEELSEDEIDERAELPIKMDEIKIEPEEIVHSSGRMLNGHAPQRSVKSLVSNIIISNTYSIDTRESSPCSADNPLLVQRFSKAVKSTIEPNIVKTEPVDLDQEDSDSDLPLDCLLCDKSLRTMSGLKAHVISCHSYKTVTKRSKLIKDKHAAVKAGKVLKNKDKKPTLIMENEQENVPTCIVCRKRFLSLKSLRNHERVHNTGCIYCQAQFPSFLALASHMEICQEKLGDTPKSMLPGKPKTVQQLRRISTVTEGVVGPKRRKTMSEEKEIFTCSQCNEQFEESIYLKIHNEIHHNVLDDEDEDNVDDDKVVESDRKTTILENKEVISATEQKTEIKKNNTAEDITNINVDKAMHSDETNQTEESTTMKVNEIMNNDESNLTSRGEIDSDTIINLSAQNTVKAEINKKGIMTSVQITNDDNGDGSEVGDKNDDLVSQATDQKENNISAEVACVPLDKSGETDISLLTNTESSNEKHEELLVIPMDLEPTVEGNNVMENINFVTPANPGPNNFLARNDLISVVSDIGTNLEALGPNEIAPVDPETEGGEDGSSELVPIDGETAIKYSLDATSEINANLLQYLVTTESLDAKAVVTDGSENTDVHNMYVPVSEGLEEKEKNINNQDSLRVGPELPNDLAPIITGMYGDAVNESDSPAIADESSQENQVETNGSEESGEASQN